MALTVQSGIPPDTPPGRRFCHQPEVLAHTRRGSPARPILSLRTSRYRNRMHLPCHPEPHPSAGPSYCQGPRTLWPYVQLQGGREREGEENTYDSLVTSYQSMIVTIKQTATFEFNISDNFITWLQISMVVEQSFLTCGQEGRWAGSRWMDFIHY